MNKVSISVAIVTWNRKDELLRAIESVFKQTYLPLEIIIVDNLSDYCVETALSNQINNSKIPIKVIRMHENVGCPIARNLAFENCKGDYIYALDDDGWLDENALEEAINIYHKHKEQRIAIVASIVICPLSGDVLTNKTNGTEQHNIFSAGAALYSKKILSDIGYFPDYFRQMEESHFAMKAYAKKIKIYRTKNSIMYHDKSDKGRVKYIEVMNNYLNEIRNIKELLSFHSAFILFIYKSYAHLKSYIKSEEIKKFPSDFIRGLSILLFYKNKSKSIMTLKEYIKFKKGVLI
ncbi:glycosyltransferase family 2 protein [Photobacterium damselae]|uniref:glycosyltransferase family 2 protein n=1 Tax=Photobacterium damselae TaxID=38293 RepID=UPI001EFDEC47|nr:glycosyltransferase [Photobacterium damselae]MCG9778641.1 glycosyltransferase [Photobacterium damselae]